MKKLTIIKQAFFATAIIAGMNIFSSCDSCSRKEAGPDETTTDMNTDGDTTSYDDSAYDDSTGTGINDGTNTSTSIKARSGSTANTKPAASSTGSASGTTKSGPSEEEIANQIENSDAKSGTVNKNGKPVTSSGAAGSGQGTGTGSTGNNSRVTTKEAQKGN